MYSPQVWGWTDRRDVVRDLANRIPHGCGGGPPSSIAMISAMAYSPRAWGRTKTKVRWLMDDLHALPKVRDSLSSLYVEHVRIDRHEKSIAMHDKEGMTPIPAATLCVLMLGPGTSISHAAITALADNNCLVVWCGEENV